MQRKYPTRYQRYRKAMIQREEEHTVHTRVAVRAIGRGYNETTRIPKEPGALEPDYSPALLEEFDRSANRIRRSWKRRGATPFNIDDHRIPAEHRKWLADEIRKYEGATIRDSLFAAVVLHHLTHDLGYNQQEARQFVQGTRSWYGLLSQTGAHPLGFIAEIETFWPRDKPFHELPIVKIKSASASA